MRKFGYSTSIRFNPNSVKIEVVNLFQDDDKCLDIPNYHQIEIGNWE